VSGFEKCDGWRLVTDDDEARYYLCRAGASRWTRACGQPSTAAVTRKHAHRDQEWHYCLAHVRAYGNDVVDGAVVRWVQDEDT
jgi:hypothetical protein